MYSIGIRMLVLQFTKTIRGHTGRTLTVGKGSIYSASKKQKLNTRSLTDTELVAADDGMGSMLWTKLFLEAQHLAP